MEKSMAHYNKDPDAQKAYEAGQKHGSEGRTSTFGGWYLRTAEAEASEKRYQNGINNQPKK